MTTSAIIKQIDNLHIEANKAHKAIGVYYESGTFHSALMAQQDYDRITSAICELTKKLK